MIVGFEIRWKCVIAIDFAVDSVPSASVRQNSRLAGTLYTGHDK